MILRVRKCVTKILIVAVLVLLLNTEVTLVSGQRNGDGLCPPQDTILPCRCSSRGNEIQIWFVPALFITEHLFYKFR